MSNYSGDSDSLTARRQVLGTVRGFCSHQLVVVGRQVPLRQPPAVLVPHLHLHCSSAPKVPVSVSPGGGADQSSDPHQLSHKSHPTPPIKQPGVRRSKAPRRNDTKAMASTLCCIAGPPQGWATWAAWATTTAANAPGLRLDPVHTPNFHHGHMQGACLDTADTLTARGALMSAGGACLDPLG
jgi:hypothetical protein